MKKIQRLIKDMCYELDAAADSVPVYDVLPPII